jgi:carboxyl-terminal processing protease
MSRVFSFTFALALVLAVLCVGIYLGGHPRLLPAGVRGAFVEEDSYDRTREALIEAIRSGYYKPVDVERLRHESLGAMVRSLGDRFSSYLPPSEAALFAQRVSGRFEGVGMSVQPNRRGLLVAEVFPKSPAERSGIHKGDVISRVDGRSIAGMATEAATALIKGPPGTEVRLTLIPSGEGDARTLTVKRARIEVPVATGRVVRGQGPPIGVVELTTFSHGAHGRLRREIDRLVKDGARALVLDLRGNGGGLLEEAVLVSSLFVEDGLIVSTDGRTKPKRDFDATGEAIDRDIPLVVLVDRGSASASEIVTGALRDRDRATVVGTPTFGKGVFQEVEELPNGGALSLTVGEYFLPNGESLANRGITPSVRARDLPRTPRDEALPAALDAARDLAR